MSYLIAVNFQVQGTLLNATVCCGRRSHKGEIISLEIIIGFEVHISSLEGKY